MKNTTAKTITGDLLCVPEELRQRPQWVVWRYERRGKKTAKVPYDPKTGRRASSTDLLTWATFEEATEALEADGYDGVGFVLSSADPYVGVDLDGCRDRETGTLEPWAAQAVRALNGYTEASPSGTGVHVIVRGKIRRSGRQGAVEVYGSERYFTVTGMTL